MSDDEEEQPFTYIRTDEKLKISWVGYDNGTRKKRKSTREVPASIYEANTSVERLPGQENWSEIVYAKKYNKYLTLQALRNRLGDPDCRKADYAALQRNPAAKPFELWDPRGDLETMPSRLILTDKYNDATQLRRWQDIASNLGKPPENFNSEMGRFNLRPSVALKAKWEREKSPVLYCTPAASPVLSIDTKRLKDIVAKNTGEFDGWPDPIVVDYDKAESMKLKLVGRHFLQCYFTWMKADHYEELWEVFKVTELLHAFPNAGDEKDCKKADGMLKKKSNGKKVAAGTTAKIDSNQIEKGSGKRTSTKSIMGPSATSIATELWGKVHMTTGMGPKSSVEWLHRVAFSLGGPDSFRNLVFGTWECNTDMIRAERMIKALTRKDAKKQDYKGILTTERKSGTIARYGGTTGGTTATIPTWAKKYSWLCFSLNYRYVMNAPDCPLTRGIAQEVDFDPWSLYVPLSMEPRLDTMILDDLREPKVTGASTSAAGSRIKKSSLASNMMATPLPGPGHSSDGYPTLAWNAAVKGLPSLELAGVVIKNPMVAGGPHSGNPPTDGSTPHRINRSILVGTPAPQGGFVLQGEIDIFGTDVVGTLEKWIGPPPDGIVTGTDLPSIERVTIPGDFHMSVLIPLLRGTPFDNIIFRNVAIYHQNYAFDTTKSIGWHFNADWVIDSSCGVLHDILTMVLQIDNPVLGIRASFGEEQHWGAPLSLHSFILDGVFSNLTLSPVEGLTLTTIGVRLLGIRGFSFTPQPHSTLSFGFGIFGTMKLKVPGSVVPLSLDYEMGLIGETVHLSAEISGSIWDDALGVRGLLLEDVAFGTSFTTTTSPWKTVSFDVSAAFSYGGSTAYLQGAYAAGGQFSFTAELDDFGTEEINDLFSTIFSDTLTLPDFDVHIESAILSIASGQGLSVALNNVTVAGFTAVSVEVDLSSSGASLSGALSKSTIKFGDVELRDALIKLSFWTTEQNKKVDLMIGGTLGVEFLALTLRAVVHLYPGENGFEWTVVAELDTLNRPFAISDVVPAIKGTFVDFSLKNAAIIATSKDDPEVGQSFPGYQVRQGVQVFGVIDRIPALNDLLHTDVHGLVLSAAWSSTAGFSLFVSLPAESTIDLGHGIKTTPITLAIRSNPIELAIMAGVTVPVKDSTPLDFSFVLAGNEIGASASAQMQGWWVRPFGIDQLKIGPEVTLSIEIIYAQFLTTGTPSGFGVSGGLMIGTIEAFLAVNVSEDPERQLFFGEVKKLGMSDLVTFAGTLLQQNVPHIPDGLLKFEELKVYICPFGVVLGKTVYPQGFSFKADMVLFEKRANIECKIDKAQKSIDISGGIDNFELGPLSVRGSKGPRATLECHVGVSKQQLSIDGIVTIFDIQAQTYIDIQFLPQPKFKFYMMVDFAHVFMYKLDAELLGSIHDKLSDADFSLYAELENDILEYIAQHIIEQFEAAKTAATHGIEVAKAKVDEAEKAWKAAISDAQSKVDDAQRKWESYEHTIRSASQPIIDNYLAEISRLQDKIDEARQTYDRAMESAQNAVNQANLDRGAALAAAERGVDDAQRSMDRGIDDAQRALDDAQNTLDRAFSDADRAIDNAQREVWRIEGEIDDIKGTIRDYDRAPWYIFWKKAAIPGLWASVWTLEAAKAVASGILDVARAVLQGADYLSKKAAVEIARQALEVSRSVGEDGLNIAKGSLQVADETSKFAVDQAENALEGVRYGTEFVAFEGAKGALEEFKKANKAAYDAAMAAIDAMMDSVAFIAFNTAKAGLEVAKGSTLLLDAAKGALSLAEEASQFALSVFEELIEFGSKAVNIKTIILSGTLRGILGVGGSNSRPLSATIKGYILGKSFDIQAEFNPKDPVSFITAIFKQLWNVLSPVGSSSNDQPASRYSVSDGDDLYDIVHGSGNRGSSSNSVPREHVAELDPGKSLYDIIHGHGNPGPFSQSSGPVGGYLPELGPGDPLYNIVHGNDNRGPLFTNPPGHFSGMQAARSKFLQQRPDVHKVLIDKSESTPVGIPRGPFSGAPLVSSQAVARRAFILMQAHKGISIFADLDHGGM